MLSGKHVTLRRVEASDYPAIQGWQNDPEVFRWMDYQRPFSLDDIRTNEERAVSEGVPFVIEADGRPVGRTGLNNFRPRDGLAALYLFIGDRGVWGKGYGTDAVMTLLAYGFDALGLRMVELWTLADNERALHIYKACGFVEDGRLRDRSVKDGRAVDHVWLSVTREEFSRVRADYGI